ncbi:MAG: lipid II flippase MurJ, partial [Bacillota bacterium]|nr:lipid II flippase MurJ [Bacillota bacterium]
ICIPCSVLLAVLGEPFIRLLFQAGEFTAENTANTAFALYFFVIGIFAQGGIHLSSRAFYAFQNTKTPVLMAIIGIVVNIIFSFILVGSLQHGGLALAYSIGGIVNLALLMYFLRRRLKRIDGKNILRSTIMTLIASAVMGVVAYFLAWGCESLFGVSNKGTQAVQLFASGLISVGVFFGMAKAMHMPEADAAVSMIKRKLKRG